MDDATKKSLKYPQTGLQTVVKIDKSRELPPIPQSRREILQTPKLSKRKAINLNQKIEN